MSMNALDARNAYAGALGRSLPVGGAGASAGAGAETSGGFGQLVEGLVTHAVEATRQSEALSRQAVTGKAELVDVVTAVNTAETALETVVAVRDRVVAAYQDLMRMPI